MAMNKLLGIAGRCFSAAVGRLLLVVTLGLPFSLGAQTSGEVPEPSINLSSQVTVQRRPDLARVRLVVRHERVTAREAVEQNSREANAVIAVVGSTGVARDSITTPNFQVGPVYRNRQGDRELTGYFATTEIAVVVRDLSGLGLVIDAAMQVGGVQVPSIVYGLDDPSEARAEAYTKAVRQLRADAEVIAVAAGVSVKGLGSISASQLHVQQPRAMALSVQEARGPNLVPGELGVSVSVSATFLVTGFVDEPPN